MDQTAAFEGWAKIELMGHNTLVGYVTTRYFGPAALFQIDVPGAAEREETLDRGSFIDDRWCPAGSVVKREAIPSASPMVGPTTIYRLTPCSEPVAMELLKNRVGRAYAIVSTPSGGSLPAPQDEIDGFDSDPLEEEDEEIPI